MNLFKISPQKFVAVSAGLIVSGLVGCTSKPRSSLSHAPTVAVAIIMPDRRIPSPQQTAHILEAMRPEVAKQGYVIAPDLRSADYVVQIAFTPDPVDNAGGRISILSMDPNQNWLNRSIPAQEEVRASADAARGLGPPFE